MQVFFKKEDLRVIKTHSASKNAMGSLLEKRRFKQITVNEICAEALISRAAFYTHYHDKYDLLEKWLKDYFDAAGKTGLRDIIDCLVYNNTRLMQNILYDADQETVEIVASGLAMLILDCNHGVPEYKRRSVEFQVLCDFCAGGLLEMIRRQKDHGKDFQNTIGYFYDMLTTILRFHNDYK